jgi:hypothetical protein
MILFVASFLLLVLADAQEKPSLDIPQYTFNVTYRQNVCDRHDDYYIGLFELRDALQGFEINSLIRVGEYFHLDDNGAIDEENPGLQANILDELAKRGGFTWRNSFAVTDGPGDNHTWTELLDWAMESYDVSVDWWVHSAERYKIGVAFPDGFVDSSYILVGFKEDDDESSKKAAFWSWLEPFDVGLWIAIAVTVVVSGALYEVVEYIEPLRGETKKRKWHPGKGLFGTTLIVLQHFHVKPRTRAGKVLSVSLAFWSLIVLATYTANLASFFVIQNTPSVEIESVDDAINAGISMCVSDGAATHLFAQANYPKGIYVPIPGVTEVEGLLNGDCGLVLTYVNKWEQFKIDKTIHGKCNLEWVGRVINFKEAGFGLKADSGRLCTSLVENVLNLHLVEMNLDGTMELLKKKFQQKTQDIDCEAINAAAGADDDSSHQLTLQEMAGPFLVHSIATGLALLLAAAFVFARHLKRKDLEPDGDHDSDTSDSAINNVDDSTIHFENSRASMQAETTELRGIAKVQKEQATKQDEIAQKQAQTTERRGIAKVQKEQATKQDEMAQKQDEIAQKQDEMMARLAYVAAVLKSMPEKESSPYPKPPSSKFALC